MLWIIPETQAFSYSGTEVRYGIICANNPINLGDPLGLYLFYIHFAETYVSEIRHGRPFSAIYVAIESVLADVGTQGTSPDDARRHAMGGLKTSRCGTRNGLPETSEEAKAGTDAFVQQQAMRYDKTHKWWLPWSGASYLGDAYHAVEDSYAKGHHYLLWEGGFPSAAHLFWDAMPSSRSLSGAYDMQPSP